MSGTDGLARLTLGGATDTGAAGLTLVEQPLRGMVTLRADLGDAAVAKAVTSVVGAAVPGVRRVDMKGGSGALWMSPDELLLMMPYEEASATVATLSDALARVHHLALDISDARTILRLEGAAAREVLAKGAPVDLSRDAFGPGDLRRTRIGTVAVAFYQLSGDPDVFEIFCFRSYARYLWDWLIASSREGTMPGVIV